VVSVAGVPPVLVAGVYGMNFHYMPELGLALGLSVRGRTDDCVDHFAGAVVQMA